MSTTTATKVGDPPTTRQAEILRFFARSWGETGRWPSIREVCAEFGIASPNGVICHIKAMVKKGELVELSPPPGSKSSARAYAVPGLLAAAGAAAADWLSARGAGEE